MDLKKIVKFSIVTITILILSELIYIFSNHPSQLATPLEHIAQISFIKSNKNLEMKLFNTAADVHIMQNKIYYPGVISDKTNCSISDVGSYTSQKITDYLATKTPEIIKNNSEAEMADAFYNIGLILYQQDYINQAEQFFTKAVLLYPSLSFLHVELANSYFNNNYIAKGKSALEFCLKFSPAKPHCTEYLNTYAASGNYEDVGYYKDLIETFSKTGK